MFGGFERRRIETIGNVTINCVVGGAGPPVLLLHGFPQTLAMWARVAPILAQSYTVACADLRGYGDSCKPRCLPDCTNYSFRAMAEDQVALMHALGFSRFHVVGHDRGGRTGHRMALDRPDAVETLSVLDIVPTYTMFMDTDRNLAGTYWHWYFLSQPEPFAERLIGHDPDHFYETCLIGWGKAQLEDFEPELLAEYRRCWRDPGTIHGSCSDYRAASMVDLSLDSADIDQKIACPTLVFFGAEGTLARLFDIPAHWRKRCTDMREASLPGGHFFVDRYPEETARVLLEFLAEDRAPENP